MKGGEGMRWWRWTTPLTVAALLGVWQFVPSQTDKMALGRTLYLRHCAACHGERGKGDGQLTKVIVPPVPDLTEGVFKLRSTPSGTLPTDDDLRRVIGEGIPATPMFGVKGLLSEEELDALVAFTKSLVPKSHGRRWQTHRHQPDATIARIAGVGSASLCQVPMQCLSRTARRWQRTAGENFAG